MGRVLNLRRDTIPASAEYIGRARRGQKSPLGNPYVIGTHGTREQVIPMFERDLKKNDTLIEYIRTEVRDRDVVCFCKPAICHGDVIVKVAAMTEAELAAWRADPNDLVHPMPADKPPAQSSFGFDQPRRRFSRGPQSS